MHDKNEELQSIYRELLEASKYRSDVRFALIGTQSEIQRPRLSWTDKLSHAKGVI